MARAASGLCGRQWQTVVARGRWSSPHRTWRAANAYFCDDGSARERRHAVMRQVPVVTLDERFRSARWIFENRCRRRGSVGAPRRATSSRRRPSCGAADLHPHLMTPGWTTPATLIREMAGLDYECRLLGAGVPGRTVADVHARGVTTVVFLPPAIESTMLLTIPGVTRLSARNPGLMTGVGNWTYFLDGSMPTLIDAGVGAADHLEELSSALGGVGVGLSRVMVTHAHADHASGASSLAARWPAAVFLKFPGLADAKYPVQWQPIVDGQRSPPAIYRWRSCIRLAIRRTSVSLACRDADAVQWRPARRGVYGRDSWSRGGSLTACLVAGAHRGDGSRDRAAGAWRRIERSGRPHRALPGASRRARAADPRGATGRGRHGDGDRRSGVR